VTPEQAAAAMQAHVARTTEDARRFAARFPAGYGSPTARNGLLWLAVRGWLESMVERGAADVELAAAVRSMLTAAADPANDLMLPPQTPATVDPKPAPGPLLSPDCAAGKCSACVGDAWDPVRDLLTSCEHMCHGVTT
jgi:hypothetical protein